jgi:hypothetical protein
VVIVIWILRRLFLKRERIFDDDEKSGGLGFCRGGCDYCMGKWECGNMGIWECGIWDLVKLDFYTNFSFFQNSHSHFPTFPTI